MPDVEEGSLSQTHTPLPEFTIPDDVSYEVVSDTQRPWGSRHVDIVLNGLVSEETLAAITRTVEASDTLNGSETWIAYYLPGMDVDRGAWAITYHNPDLSIDILGLTVDAANRLTEEPVPADRDEIGRWLEASLFGGFRLAIYREDNRLFIEATLHDRSTEVGQVAESESPLGRRFDKVGDPPSRYHWVINSKGDLQIHDDDDLITTARRITSTASSNDDHRLRPKSMVRRETQ